jgi:hypothetical protein
MSKDPNERTPLDAKLYAITYQSKPKGKRERAIALDLVLQRVSEAMRMRRRENVQRGRSDNEDDLLEALDAAENKLLALGALPKLL